MKAASSSFAFLCEEYKRKNFFFSEIDKHVVSSICVTNLSVPAVLSVLYRTKQCLEKLRKYLVKATHVGCLVEYGYGCL